MTDLLLSKSDRDFLTTTSQLTKNQLRAYAHEAAIATLQRFSVEARTHLAKQAVKRAAFRYLDKARLTQARRQNTAAQHALAKSEAGLSKAMSDLDAVLARTDQLNAEHEATLEDQRNRLQRIEANLNKALAHRSPYTRAQEQSFLMRQHAEELEEISKGIFDADLRLAYAAEAESLRQWRGES
jgi:hypothetical protein